MVTKIGTSAAEKLKGTTGKDKLTGLGGSDTLTGNAGNDVLDGGKGNDSLNGGSGNDTYLYKTNSFGTDTLTDSDGIDLINMSALTSAITAVMDPVLGGDEVAVGLHTINWDVSVFIENFTAGKGDDDISGNDLDNTLLGNAGADTLDGGKGSDTLDGGDGNDSLIGGNDNDVLYNSIGSDILDGGAGNDIYIYKTLEDDGAGNGDQVSDSGGGVTTDTLDFSAITAAMAVGLEANIAYPLANPLLKIIDSATSDLSGIENVITGDGNDFIIGNDLDNLLISGKGRDTVVGDAGNDILVDGDGEDLYNGGAGNDLHIFTRGQTNMTEVIFDASGSADQIRLVGFTTGDVTFQALDLDIDGNLDNLLIYDYVNNWALNIYNYFDNTSPTPDGSGAGSGCMENIAFDDDLTNSFDDIIDLYFPT